MIRARARAKEKGLEFNLTEEDVQIPPTCPVLGISIRPGNGVLCDNSPTVDRINNMKGYIKGNVEVISWKANRIKSNATYKEVKAVAMWVRSKELGF